MSLELARTRGQPRLYLVTQHLPGLSGVPGLGVRGVEGLPSRDGLSARPSLPAFGPRKSTWSARTGGLGGEVGTKERREQSQRTPHSPCALRPMGSASFRASQQLRSCSEKDSAEKDSRGGSDVWEGKALPFGLPVLEALRAKVTPQKFGALTRRNQQNVHERGNGRLKRLGAGRRKPEMIGYFKQTTRTPLLLFCSVKTYIGTEFQRKLVRLLLYRLLKQTDGRNKATGRPCTQPRWEDKQT